MKHRTELLKHIAALNIEDKPATVVILFRRTFIPTQCIRNVLFATDFDGWTEGTREIWLTESGWDQYERDKPRAVSADMLLVHADGGEA